ncbi:MAG TPA: hypothetical protein VMM18_18075, partial [Gemmatimonadaceae bacterium]|nr:hypothetical protein [Gemmatimonadaceae bacterium]
PAFRAGQFRDGTGPGAASHRAHQRANSPAPARAVPLGWPAGTLAPLEGWLDTASVAGPGTGKLAPLAR